MKGTKLNQAQVCRERWQRPPIQTSESPKDVALGAALRYCSARCHGTALSHLGSADDAQQKRVVLSGEGSTAQFLLSRKC